MKYTHVIWDFNGTILDDVTIGIEAINVMLSSRNMNPIDSVDAYRKSFGFPIKEYYRRVGFDFSKEDYESVLAPEWVKEYKMRENKAGLCVGVEEALGLLKDNGIKQSIVSGSSSDLLYEQVDRLGIRNYFECVIGLDNFFAYGKSELCRSFVQSRANDRFIMIGDSTHDSESAHAAGIDVALVLTGHMSREVLSECNCLLFDNARDFACYLIKNNN